MIVKNPFLIFSLNLFIARLHTFVLRPTLSFTLNSSSPSLAFASADKFRVSNHIFFSLGICLEELNELHSPSCLSQIKLPGPLFIQGSAFHPFFSWHLSALGMVDQVCRQHQVCLYSPRGGSRGKRKTAGNQMTYKYFSICPGNGVSQNQPGISTATAHQRHPNKQSLPAHPNCAPFDFPTENLSLIEKMHAFCTTEFHPAAIAAASALDHHCIPLLQYPSPSLDGDATQEMSVSDSTGRLVNTHTYTQLCTELLFECVCS